MLFSGAGLEFDHFIPPDSLLFRLLRKGRNFSKLSSPLPDEGIDCTCDDDEDEGADDDALLVSDDVVNCHLLYSESISKPTPSIFIIFKNFNLLIS